MLLNGTGGIGKTALAIEYLNQYQNVYDHIAFVQDDNEITGSFLTAFKDSTKLTGTTPEERFDELLLKLENLNGKNLLIVDNIQTEANFERIKNLSSRFDLLITSRTAFNTVNRIDIEHLPEDKAKALFLEYYSTDKSIDKLLEYLDYHTLFIKLTAQTLANSNILSIKQLETKFANGEFGEVTNNLESSTFNTYLSKLFNLNTLDKSDVLLLKRLSLFPSIEISFEQLKDFLSVEDAQALDADLTTLAQRGWLIKNQKTFKLHQIIKEFLLAIHPIAYKECDDMVQTFSKNLYVALTTNPIYGFEFIPFAVSIANNLSSKDKNIATLLNNIASIYRAMGELEKSLEFRLKDLTLKEEILGDKDPSLATSYNNIALIYKDMGELEKALEFQLKALTIREEVLGDKHPDLATSYNNIATIYNSMGELEKALEFQLKAITLMKEVLGDKHPFLATSYNNIALIYKDMGKLEKALEFALKALTIREEVLGDKHPDLARSYNNISEIYRVMGEQEKALEFQLKALTLREEVLGDKHPDLAIGYNNLSLIYNDMGEPEKALKFTLKAITLKEEVLGKNHPSLAISYANIAQIYFQNANIADAKKCIGKAEKIFSTLFPNGHPHLDATIAIKEQIYSHDL
jgi:tetratricopeptide (TPR) repeat protein